MSEYTNSEMYTVYLDSAERGPFVDAFVAALENKGYLVKKVLLRVYYCCDTWFHGLLERCPKCGTHIKDIPNDEDHVKRVADATSELGKWAVEFKWSEGDLWGSMTGKRIYDQMEIGSVVYGNHYSVAVRGYESSMVMDHPQQENWIRSIQPKAFHKYAIGFKWCEDEEGMLKYFEAQRAQAYKPSETHRRKRRLSTKCRQVDAVSLPPLMGVKKAKDLLLSYGSVKRIVELTSSQLRSYPGISDKTATAFINFWEKDVRDEILEEMTEKGEIDDD